MTTILQIDKAAFVFKTTTFSIDRCNVFSSSKGAHHTEARLGSGSSGAGGSANDMNSESYTKNLLNSKSSGKDSTTQHINGLIRTKPTNLVIPSATKPTNPVPPTQHNTSSSADKVSGV